MTMKKLTTKITSVVLALILCLGLSTTAFAAEDPTAKTVEAKITKELQMDTNVTTPSVTFSFEVSKVSLDGVDTEEAKNTMPAISEQTLAFGSSDTGTTPANSNLKTVTKTTANIVPAAGEYPHAGIYKYHIKEKTGTYTTQTGETMTYSQAEYDMTIYVVNDTTGLKIDSVTVNYTKDDNGNAKTDKATIKFVNQYAKNNSLTISKAVTGAMGDKTKEFNFTLSLSSLSALEENNAAYTGVIHRADGTTTETATLTSGANTTFSLKDTEYIVFSALSVGTKYTVSEQEKNQNGYTTTVKVTANGQEITGNNAESNVLVGENENKVEYTNNKETTVPTGILVNNLPFIILIIVAICGFSGYIVFRRRKSSN